MVNGKMEKDMEKEFILILIKIHIVDGGHLEIKRVMEHMYIPILE